MFVNPADEEMLLRSLSEGDEKAFLKIYDQYWYKVYLIAYKRIKDQAIAEELTQDLFLKLWEKRATIKPHKIENYLFVAIRNSVIDHISSGLVKNKYIDFCRVFGEGKGNATQDIVAFDDLSEAIDKGLTHLPDKSQQVFKLSRLDSWPTDKIARHLNLSEKTVGYHLTKSIKFMRTYLREYLLMIPFFIAF